MRHLRANSGDRSNALWGRGSRGESRSNALWGRGGRRAGAVVAMVSMFAMASVAAAGRNGGGNRQGYGDLKSYVPDTLLSAIQQNPRQSFDVILQGDRKVRAHGWVTKVLADKSGSSDENVGAGDVKREFQAISGAQLTLTGRQILRPREAWHRRLDRSERDGKAVGILTPRRATRSCGRGPRVLRSTGLSRAPMPRRSRSSTRASTPAGRTSAVA